MGTRLDAEAISFQASTTISSLYTGEGLLALDFSNAFITIDRTEMLQSIRDLAPAFSQYAFFCYGQPTPLLGDGFVIESACGTQQGDVCGPLFFALSIHKLVTRLDMCGLSWHRWYLDDCIIKGDFAALAHAVSMLRSDGSKIGLQLNESKCKMFIPSLAPPPQHAVLAKIPVVSGGIILGVPIGGHTFVESELTNIEQSFEGALNKLCCLGQPQVATAILRSCLGSAKIVFLLRTLGFTDAVRLAHTCSLSIKTALSTIVGSPLSQSQWILASLPSRMGGLGITDPVMLPAAAAVSSFVSLIGAENTTGIRCTRIPPNFVSAARRLSEQTGGKAALSLLTAISRSDMDPEQFIHCGLEPEFASQAFWSNLIHVQAAQTWETNVSDRASRMRSLVSAPHARIV